MALCVAFLLVVIAAPASAEEPSWEFNSPGELAGWNTFGVDSFGVEGGALRIKWSGLPKIAAPAPLSIEPYGKVLHFSIKSDRERIMVLRLLGEKSGEIAQYKIGIRGDSSFNEHRIYLGNSFTTDERIAAFAMEFLVFGGEVEIDFLRIEEPTGSAWSATLWRDFWKADTLNLALVNSTANPRFGPYTFNSLLYIFTFVVFILLLAYLAIRRGSLDRRSVVRALAVAFLVGSGLYAIRMDHIWVKMRAQDKRLLAPLEVRDRAAMLTLQNLYGFMDFVDFVKKNVPPTEMVRPATLDLGGYSITCMQYYLLPIKQSPRARYIWSFMDKGLRYDPASMSLVKEGRVIARGVEPVVSYKDSGALYRYIRERGAG